MKLDKSEDFDLVSWQNICAEEHIRKTEHSEEQSTESKVRGTNERYYIWCLKEEIHINVLFTYLKG